MTGDIPLVPSGNRDMYSELAVATGPANNGEPCRHCGTPIARTAHPVQRARHVCSPRCNDLLKRKHKRALAKEKEAARERATASEPRMAPEDLMRYEAVLTAVRREPRVFRTLESATFPYEFTNGSPIEGDVVERDGAITRYLVSDGLFFAHSDETGSQVVLGCVAGTRVSVYDYWTHLYLRVFLLDGTQVRLHQPFEHDGRTWVWSTEIIREIGAAGADYTWRAIVCTNEPRSTLWDQRSP